MKSVVAAIALAIAAVALPNLHEAMQRSKEKRTMADMRLIATAWEARAEHDKTYSIGRSSRVTFAELRRALEPKYVSHLPRADGWGNPFELTAAGNEYSIRSWGSDHRRDERLVEGAHTDFARDVVYSNGVFVAHPEGL